tara:strand:- start:52313 stop:55492 length:3180 start_codon:yes stop_codon:yes gene_type:complete
MLGSVDTVLEQVESDVFEYPSGEPVKHDGSVTVGDMHGNAIKLTQLLMHYGVVSLDENSFNSMVELYGEMESLLSTREIEDLHYAQVKINNNKEAGISRGMKLVHAIVDLKDNQEFLKGIADRNKDNSEYQNIFKCLTRDSLNNLKNLESKELERIVKAIIDARIVFNNLNEGAKTSNLEPFFSSNSNSNMNPLIDMIRGIIEERAARVELDAKKQALEKNISAFDALLDKIDVRDNTALVRLIGDELADRGSNDYYTLKILERLNEKGVNFNINVSNHSNEFIMSYERRNAASAEADASIGEKTVVSKKQGISLGRLEYLLSNGIVQQGDLDRIIENVYKPSLRIIDYSLTDDGISLFTHAPVQFQVIKCLADKVGVVYDDSSKEALAETIEKVNLVVHETYIKENRLSELFAADTHASMEEYPLNHMAWNRWNDTQENDASDLRPSVVNGFSVDYFHGHDDYQSKKAHVHNLDTESGKFGQAFKQQERLALEEEKAKIWKKYGVVIKGLEKGHSLNEVGVQQRQKAAYEAVRKLVVAGGEGLAQNIQGLGEITIDESMVEHLVREIKMLENAAAQYAEKQTTKYLNVEQRSLDPKIIAELSVGDIKKEFLREPAQRYFDNPSEESLGELWTLVGQIQAKKGVYELAAQRQLDDPSSKNLENLATLVRQGSKQAQKQAKIDISNYLKVNQTDANSLAARQIKSIVKSRTVRMKHFFKKKIITPQSIENLKREAGNILPILRGAAYMMRDKLADTKEANVERKASPFKELAQEEKQKSMQSKTHSMPDVSLLDSILPAGKNKHEDRLLSDIRSAPTVGSAQAKITRLLTQNKEIYYTKQDGTEVTKEGKNEYFAMNDFLEKIQKALAKVSLDIRHPTAPLQTQEQKSAPVTTKFNSQFQSAPISHGTLIDESKKHVSDFMIHAEQAVRVLKRYENKDPLPSNINNWKDLVKKYNEEIGEYSQVTLPDDFKVPFVNSLELKTNRLKLESFCRTIIEAQTFAETKGTDAEAATYFLAVINRAAKESGLAVASQVAKKVESSLKTNEPELGDNQDSHKRQKL